MRDRSRRLAAQSLKHRRSRDTAPRRSVREARLPAGLEVRVVDCQHVIRIELFGDLSRTAAGRLFGCLERALDTRAEMIILDLRGLDRLDPEAVSPILIAQLTADSEHRQLLLIPGPDAVQQVLDRIQGPFAYLDPDDDWRLGDDHGRSVLLTAGRRPARFQGWIAELLLGPTDRLIAATEHAPEPIRTLEYLGARALLGALELWLLVEQRVDRSRRW